MPNGPGPRQRRATKIANRSHVTPFDRLAQWNAQIMNLGAQGSIPSIVGNDLQFKKLTASDISGVMHKPAIEDLIMGQWDILFSANGNIGMTTGAISGVSTLSSSQNLQISSQTSTLVTGGGFEVQPVLGGEIKLQCASTGGVGPIYIVWPNSTDANSYNITIGGNRTSGSCQVNIMNNNYNNSISSILQLGSGTLGSNRISARQIDIDAGTNGLQMGSDAGVTIDAATNFEIDAGGILDLSGNQIVIDASSMTNGVGVNISAANAITMDAANIDVEATTKLDLSGTNITINSSNGNIEVKAGATLDLSSDNTKLNGTTTVDITGSTIDMRYDVSMNVTQDISTNEIWIKNIGGSGYARQRENDSGFGSSGWPSTNGNSQGNNTIVKIGRWVDYGGLAAVNMWTVPNISPWNQMSNSNSVIQDGRSLVGMNLRSTYNYFLKRFAQGNLQMGDFQVRQKSARFFEQNETDTTANITTEGDIGFVKISGNTSNRSFVYYGNNDIITMKNPMSLSFSSRYAYGTNAGIALWRLTDGSGGSLSLTSGTSSTLGQFRFIKPAGGSNPSLDGPVSWASDNVMSPGSGCLPKIAIDGGNMFHSRNNIPQSGWIVGFIVMEGGNNITFESYQANTSGATTGTPGPFGTLSFDIITGTISSSGVSSTVLASDIHFHTLNGGTRTQRTMKTFQNAIRYDNITTGLGIRFKVTVSNPQNPQFGYNFVSIKGNTLLIELLVIEDVKL